MNEFLEVFCSSIILAFVEIYIWSRLLKEKIKLNNIKNIFLIIISSLFISLNYLFNNQYLKFIFITLFFSLVVKIISKKSFMKSLSVAVFTQLIVAVSEILFVIFVFAYRTNNVEIFKTLYFSKFYSNLIISLISIIIINLIKIKIFIFKILDLIDKINKTQLFFLFCNLLLSINLLFGLFYYQLNSIFIVLIISIIMLIYIFITIQSITQQENLENIRIEYDQLMDKSVEYEQILDENKRDLHELKNDFSVLQVLIEKSKSEALEQLDFMVKEYGNLDYNSNDIDNYYYKTLRIPSGGLRGLLSTKLKLMDELKISYNLRIGHCINSKMLENTDKFYVRQIGKLLGIYLDNSISAVKNLNKRNINIEIYANDISFNILISNNLGGILEIDKVGTMGYTTNGSGHGYGLSLAKEILNNNNKIKVNTNITGNTITKIISLKI